jgi:4-amino-4-deoxy-L-arabinose transferase-like glycosyltransferase
MPRASRRWYFWLGLITLAGLALRVGFVVFFRRHAHGWGDPYFYSNQANLLVEGHGLINPFAYLRQNHTVVQAADFPPLYTLVLAAASLVGLKSFFAHAVWTCFIGAAAVAVVGLLGREVAGDHGAGRRVGLIAAAIAAVYPNLWMSNGLVQAESLSVLMTALVLLFAYRFWRRPEPMRALVLGLSLGLAILTRDELALLVVFLALPLALLARSLRLGRRLALLGVALLSVVVVLAPWATFNLTRFQNPELISTGLGVTLATANCDTTYYGRLTGYWSLNCALKIPVHGDESVSDSTLRHAALQYVGNHTSRLPAVIGARLGRAFGLYKPIQQVNLDVFLERRPKAPAFIGLYMYYVLAVSSLVGAWLLHRRRVIIYPMLAVAANVVVSVIVAFGQTRYRSPLEVVLVVLAAVAYEALLPRRRPHARDEIATVPAPALAPVEPPVEPRAEPVPLGPRED